MNRFVKFAASALALSLVPAMLMGCGKKEAPTGSDLDYIKQKGTLVVGITDFAPMDYQDADGSWIGFDADLAKAFAESLGVEVQFQTIEWDNKVMELDGKTIDVVWNGMTLTDEVTSSMACSNAYCNNAQVVILPADKAADYSTTDSLSVLRFAVESGSAGMAQAEEKGLTYTDVVDQATALLEVKSGTADAAIIDSLMAGAMVGEGTNYADLAIGPVLNAETGEQYGVGFRKDSDAAEKVNEAMQALIEDGTLRAADAGRAVRRTGRADRAEITERSREAAVMIKTVLSAMNGGFLQTLKLFAVTLAGALPLGLLLSFCSMSRFKPLKWLTRTLVWIVRGTPLMLQLLILYYVPGVLLGTSPWAPGEPGRFLASAIAFILNYAFYFSEIFRAGIEGVPKGQQEAAQVLGLTGPQTFFHVTLLQMVKRIVPPLSNEVITLVKDTSIARIISMQELIYSGYAFLKGSHGYSGLLWPIFFTGVYYLAFNGILTLLFGRIEKRLQYFS